MAFPQKSGFKTPQNRSSSTTPQPHPSLPARPPPSSQPLPPAFKSGAQGNFGANDNRGGGHGGYNSFGSSSIETGSQGWQSRGSAYSAAPSHYTSDAGPPGSYGTGYLPGTSQQQGNYYQQANQESYGAPHIQNPFPLPGQNKNSDYDPEYEAQIAQWQSAYMSKDDSGKGNLGKSGRGDGAASAGGANAVPLGARLGVGGSLSSSEMNAAVNPSTGVAAVVSGPDGAKKTVVRSGGGTTWQDSTLLEWDPNHFRLFVGNLAGEVTDESLMKAFSKFDSLVKGRVVRDKRTTKSKGYGFVSFTDSEEMFRAAKEMNGKYIGSHPVSIKRSTTDIRPVTQADKKKSGSYNAKGNKTKNDSILNASTGAGIQKKQPKTKGGIRFLG